MKQYLLLFSQLTQQVDPCRNTFTVWHCCIIKISFSRLHVVQKQDSVLLRQRPEEG